MKIAWTEPAASFREHSRFYCEKYNRRAALGSGPEDKDKTDGDSAKGSSKKLEREGRVRGTYELVILALPYIVP